jgi:hypothetical protein
MKVAKTNAIIAHSPPQVHWRDEFVLSIRPAMRHAFIIAPVWLSTLLSNVAEQAGWDVGGEFILHGPERLTHREQDELRLAQSGLTDEQMSVPGERLAIRLSEPPRPG